MYTRREMIGALGAGLGSVGLAALLNPAGAAPHFKPRVKRVIQLFMNGAALPATPFAASHVYSFVVQGTGGRLSFNYNDIPGTFVDNSGSFTVTIAGQ